MQAAAQESKEVGDCCRLCLVEKLFFEPPPIYCTACGRRIQRNKAYYSIGAGEQRQCVCTKCYGDFRGDTITIEGLTSIPKNRLEKKINNDETEEGVRTGLLHCLR